MANYCFAQDAIVSDLKNTVYRDLKKEELDSGKVWKKGGTFNLNVGQGSQSNWSAGGDNFSFSINSYVGLFAFYKKDRYSWDNTMDLNYGLVNTTSLGSRKNDDRMDVLSKLGYELQPKLNLTGLFNFHSQFSKGYKYSGSTSRELLSDFMSPGYFLISMGLDYKPSPGLSIFMSPVTSRWTIVMNDSLSAKSLYGVDSAQHVQKSIGAFASITYVKNITPIISYNGRVDLFSNYEHHPENVDVMMNNKFVAKFSKILSASLALDLIYDDDVKLFGPNHDSPGLQLKSVIAVGVSVKW
jgi:hypothetical protein